MEENTLSPTTPGVDVVLRELRDERDWSQATLARRAGLGVATIARYENRVVDKRTGKVDIPKPATLRKLARALGDGSAERQRDALRRLYDAAGHSAAVEADGTDPAKEMAQLRARIEALEQQRITTDPAEIEARLERLIDGYPPEKRTMALTLLERALARYKASQTPRPEAPGE